ncbi:hypothetical protein GRI89_17705 [Altererythrobacter salegens]|uniref:PRC-barrel domain-containing protein n=1 Tax=Croceibacterium salegens TaxID=1737568 RepID=A0A6I4SZF2_9SPHN|nr:hypothetical protein [Croceibacterium salegens]MXO61381.1 hypothetical protein [Croceibacterium salegens]
MNLTKTIFAAALITFPAVASAQDVGATVMGNDEAAVGTVVSNDGTNVVIDTGKHKVPLAAASFANNDGVYSVNISKGELDAMMDKAAAEAAAKVQAALVVGAPVVTADAKALGTVDQIDGTNVVIKGEDDFIVTLPSEMFAVNQDGALMALANLADIQRAVEAAGG